MPLKLHAIEQRLETLLALHAKLVSTNLDKHAIDRTATMIRRLLKIYEAGIAA